MRPRSASRRDPAQTCHYRRLPSPGKTPLQVPDEIEYDYLWQQVTAAGPEAEGPGKWMDRQLRGGSWAFDDSPDAVMREGARLSCPRT